MLKYVILLFWIIISTVIVQAQPTGYAIEKYSIKNGLPTGKIETIFQDHIGFIWIGTENGLVKYDGYSFTNYKNILNDSNSLNNNIITCIYESPDSILFIATRGGLHIYNRSHDNFHRIASDNQIGYAENFSVRSMCSDNTGNHYITGFDNKRIFQISIDKKSNKALVKPFQYPPSCVNNFFETVFNSRNQLWFMSKFDLLCYQNGKVKKIQIPQVQSYVYFNSIAFAPDGTLYIATNKGIYKYNEIENAIKIFDLKSDSEKIEELNVTCLTIDNEGTFYITCENHGLYILDKTGKQVGHYVHDKQNDESIGSNSIGTIYVDRQKNIWLGTLQNDLDVLLVKPKFFEKHIYSTKASNNGLISNLINCSFVEGKNLLWLGTDGGGLQKYDLVSDKITNIGEGVLKSNKIIALTKDSSHYLWICTFGGGLSMYDFNTSTTQNIPLLSKGKEIENVYDAKIIKPDILLVASLGQGLIMYNMQTKQSITIDSVLWNNSYLRINQYLSRILIDNQSNIWLASLGEGIYEFNKDLKFIDHFDSNILQNQLSNNLVTSLSISSDGKLWAGTYDGLNIIDLKTKKISIISEKEGLSSSIVNNVNCLENNAWVVTNSGISKININTLTIENLGEIDGLWSLNSKYKFVDELHDGKILVGGDYGCMIFHKDSIKSRLMDLNFNITSIKANGKSVGRVKDSVIELQYYQNNLSIEFVALLHNYSSQIEYEYSLNNDNWISLEHKHELLFPNLTDGEYTIKLKAFIIGKKKQAELITVKIVINPPFWKTWWFSLICILFVALAIYIYVRRRVYRMQKQAFILEQKVAERTQKIQVQKDEIESQANKLKAINDELVRTNSNQSQLFSILAAENTKEKPDTDLPKSLDEEMLEKTIKYINDNLNDTDLDIEQLSENVHYSKIQFYRKIKSFTGLNPVDIIRITRLQRAEEYLRSGKYTISEVCYSVGFNDPRYFSKCFKEQFKCTPSEYVKKFNP